MSVHFAIVKFPQEDDALGVVALKWVSSDGKYCSFPNVSTNEKRDKLLRVEAEPADDWINYPIKIMHKYETYSEARRHLRRAEDTSNLSSDEDEVRKKRKPKMKIMSLPGEESDDSESSRAKKQPKVVRGGRKESTPSYPSLETFMAANNSGQYHGTPSSGSQLGQELINSGAPLQSERSPFSHPPTVLLKDGNQNPASTSFGKVPQSSLSGCDRLILAQMQATLANLTERIEALDKKVDVLLANQGSCQEPITECDSELSLFGLLPLKCQEDFDVFNDKLREENFAKKFVKLLLSVGGKDLRSTVINIMRRLFTDDLAMEFSYTGRTTSKEINQAKRPFQSSDVCSKVHLSLKKVYREGTEESIKNAICLWLQQAKHRLMRRGKGEKKSGEDVNTAINEICV